MAFNFITEYPGQIDSSDLVGYPYGKAQNITTPSDGTGTPWEKRLVNDLFGFWQSILKDATDLVPSGSADKVGASQYLQGLKILMGRGGVKLATANFTALKADGVELIHVTTGGSGNIDIILSDVADSPGRKFKVKMVDAGGTVTVKTESAGVTIDGVSGTTGIVLRDINETLAVFEANSLWQIQGKQSTDVGTIEKFGGSTVPGHYRACDGSAISRTTFAALFAVIGTKYGIGDGSTTFNLPNNTVKTNWIELDFANTPAGFSLTRGVGRVAQDSLGQYYMDLTIIATISTSSNTSVDILGIAAEGIQALTARHGTSGSAVQAFISGSNNVTRSSNTSTTSFYISGSFLLTAKPGDAIVGADSRFSTFDEALEGIDIIKAFPDLI